MEHEHRYVLVVEGNQTEMLCECGKNIKSIYKGAQLVDYEEVVEVSASDSAVLRVEDEAHINRGTE